MSALPKVVNVDAGRRVAGVQDQQISVTERLHVDEPVRSHRDALPINVGNVHHPVT